MAHKTKKSGKKTGKKKGSGRKVGAATKSHSFETFAWLLAGAAGGLLAKRLLENALAAQTKIVIDPKLLHFGEMVGGSLLGYFVHHPAAVGAGVSIGGQSLVQLLADMQVIKGVDTVDPGLVRFGGAKWAPRERMNGASKPAGVAGTNVYGYPSAANVGKMSASAMYAGAGL